MEQSAAENQGLGTRRKSRNASRQRRKADTTTQQEPDPNDMSTAEKKTRRPRKNRKEPMCKVQGCNASVANMKTLNVRYRICDMHAKAPVVMQDGEQMRFCQQCSRLQPVGEFDENKRSCRYKLELIGKRRRSRLESENKAQLQNAAATGGNTSESGRLFTPQALQAHHLGADSATAEVDDDRDEALVEASDERVGTVFRGESNRGASTSSGLYSSGRQSLGGAFQLGGGQPLSLKSDTSFIGRKHTHQSEGSKPDLPSIEASQKHSNPLYDTTAVAGASSFDFGRGLLPLTSGEVKDTSDPIPLLDLQSMGHVSWLPDPPTPHGDSHHHHKQHPPPLTRQLPMQFAGPAGLLEKDDLTDLSMLPDYLLPISPGSYFMPQLPNQSRPW